MNKLFLIGLVVIIAIGALVIFMASDEDPISPPASISSTEPAAKEPPQGPEPEPKAQPETPVFIPPSFDVVRVNPKGDAVIAGQAHPRSIVVIKDGDQVLGEVETDDRGEWVFLPEEPLEPGDRNLNLEMRIPGQDTITSKTIVVLSVPEPEQTDPDKPSEEVSGTFAVEVPKDGSLDSRILQQPSASGENLAISIDAVDYDETGRLILSGRTDAGGAVFLYLDDQFLGRAQADNNGSWTLQPDRDIEPGTYQLRADRVDPSSKVLARAQIPFRKDPALPDDFKDGTFVIIQPGNSLWRIARRSYGSGVAYTVIFEANKEQIADPDLIFPGQIFSLPSEVSN